MSGKLISEKLFIQSGSRFLLVNTPDEYLVKLGALPAGVVILGDASTPVEAIQVFVANRLDLEEHLPKLKKLLTPKGMLWVTYHNGTSKVKTDVNRDTINAYAHSIELEGVVMISIDNDWSALRLKHILRPPISE